MINKSHILICKFIHVKSRILDLGCGDGSLLSYIKTQKNIIGYGVEKDSENIKQCLKRGHCVYHGDIESCLQDFRNKSYDTVILSETLQEIQNPSLVIQEMNRIANKVIIIIPNFAYWKARLQLLFGTTPKTKMLPYSWHNTPNIRAITIKEFKQFCDNNNFNIQDEIHIYRFKIFQKILPLFIGNLFCPKALFVISS